MKPTRSPLAIIYFFIYIFIPTIYGSDLYSKKNLSHKEYLRLESMTARDDQKAAYYLGELHENGSKGIIKDYKLSLMYYKLSASLGNKKAWIKVGDFALKQNYSGTINKESAIDAYDKSDSESGFNKLANIYLADKDIKKAHFYYERSKSIKDSLYNLGLLNLNRQVKPFSLELAVKYFKNAFRLGCERSSYELGIMNGMGIYFPKSETIAFQYFLFASDHGHKESMIKCASLLIFGRKIKHDIPKAKDILLKIDRDSIKILNDDLRRTYASCIDHILKSK